MIQPVKYKSREPLNSLTGIKSSLGNLRKVVALTYLLYLANNKNEMVVYSKTNNAGGIDIKDEYKRYILSYLNDSIQESELQNNPLLSSQIESLYVGITLMFGLGKISFENPSFTMTKERTGRTRYPKQIHFASNIITLDLILQGIDEETRKQFLCSWLKDNHLGNDIELRIATFLNICIENNLFKLRKADKDILFQTEGIYLGLNTASEVSLDSDEKVGPARIFNSMLNEGLVPWLSVNHSCVSFDNNCSFNSAAYSKIISTSLDIRDIKVDKLNDFGKSVSKIYAINLSEDNIVNALKTKPFLLLAGISGTGKSQKVQELAFMTCPKGEQFRPTDSTTPGNYCLIEVKPNWHDSTELLGYYSALSGKYELTNFIRFTYKAIQNPTVPFFLCLDEMNLAPVEQYFAEFLSVLETRKRVDGSIKTQPLIDKKVFANCKLQEYVRTKEEGDIQIGANHFNMRTLYDSEEDTAIIEFLKENGLCLPDNLFVVGTVNMDDTTHQFSRKVIDRAFTIEMNGGKMEDMFSSESKALLEYRDDPISIDSFKSKFVRAHEVLDDERYIKYSDCIKTVIPKLLGNSDGTADPDSINGILNGTPFRVSYRVQNELVLYLSVLIENAGFPENIDNLIGEATLAILLEKVLPRIQGEQKQLETNGGKSNILKDLKVFVEEHFSESSNSEDTENIPLFLKVVGKLDEMDKKLNGYYTNFF